MNGDADTQFDGEHSSFALDDLFGAATSAGIDLAEVVQTSPGTGIGRYLIISKLGAGAMGEVLAAFDPELDRKVALKLLKHRFGDVEQASKRLRREAQSLAKLDHPNVVRVFDVGTHANQLFVAMEFVDGQTLGEWLAAGDAPRAWPEVLDVFMAAGRGLAAAHAVGMVHRDFKPDNVMVGADGRVRVMDFGLARGDAGTEAADSSAHEPTGQPLGKLTQTGAVLGTPAYMSLEQFRGEVVDARSDQFSFCVALHEALYGQRPFAANTLSGLMAALANEEIQPPPPGARVPAWLGAVATRGLAREPASRFESMQALLDALAADPVARLRSWATRLGLLAVLAASVWGLVWLGGEVVERDRVIADKQVELEDTIDELEQANAELGLQLGVQKGLRAAMLAAGSSQEQEFEALRVAVEAFDNFELRPQLLDLPGPMLVGLVAASSRARTGPVVYAGDTAEARIWALSGSPDGTRLVATGDAGTRIWSAPSAEPIAHLPEHHGRALAYSPDGSEIVVGDDAGTLHYFDRNGGLARPALDSRAGAALSLRYSADGSQLAGYFADGAVHVWGGQRDVALVLEVGEPYTPSAPRNPLLPTPWDLAFSPDGVALASVSSVQGAEHATVWDLDGGRVRFALDIPSPPFSFSLSSDAAHIAVGVAGELQLWSAAGEQVEPALTIAAGYPVPIGWSPDSSALMYIDISAHETILVDRRSGETRWTTKDARAPIEGAVFSPDGSMVACIGPYARVFDLRTGERLAVFERPEAMIMDLAFLRGGAGLVTLSSQQELQLHSLLGPTQLADPRGGPGYFDLRGKAWSSLSPDGAQVAATHAGQLSLWDSDSGRVRTSLARSDAEPLGAVFSADGRSLAVASANDPVRVWELEGSSGAQPVPGTQELELGGLSPTGDRLMTVEGGAWQLWSVSQGARLMSEGEPSQAEILAHRFSPDGTRLVVASANEVGLWDLDAQRELITVPSSSSNLSIAFSADSQHLGLTAGVTVELRDARTGALLGTLGSEEESERKLPPTSVFTGEQLAFSPHGRLLAHAYRRELELWDVGGERIAVLRGHDDEIERVVFSPDSQLLASADRDGRVRLWATNSGTQLATFSAGGKVHDLVFSPDGERLRALVEDGTWSWPTSAARWLQRACTQLAWAEAHGEISRRVCMHPTL